MVSQVLSRRSYPQSWSMGTTNSHHWWPGVKPIIIRYSFIDVWRMDGWVGLAAWGYKEVCWHDIHGESNLVCSHGGANTINSTSFGTRVTNTHLKHTLKAIDDFKNNQINVWSNVFWYVKVYFQTVFSQLYIDVKKMLKKLASSKINGRKKALFFLSRAPAHHNFTCGIVSVGRANLQNYLIICRILL